MIKYFCDRCGKEMNIDNGYTIPFRNKNENGIMHHGGFLICNECYHRWNEVKDRVSDLDFIKMLDEELQPYRCNFKVGDQVITSAGEVGVIKSICTCEMCKERGFFEPQVETEIGNWTIWITDNDLRVGFKSFYKIGDHIFGNIDEQCVLDEIEYKKKGIYDMQKQLIQLDGQLMVIKKLKETKDESKRFSRTSTKKSRL